MSEENKDLGDKAEDAFDAAKDKAKDLGDKAEDAFDDAKEKAGDFADKAEEAAKDFKEDVKETFDPNNPDSGKTIAIIAHLTLVGWVIAYFMNSSNKTEIGAFYLRHVLGIMLLGLVLSLIPILNLIAWVLPLVLWLMSLISCINGEQKPVFLVGTYFQDWFKGL